MRYGIFVWMVEKIKMKKWILIFVFFCIGAVGTVTGFLFLRGIFPSLSSHVECVLPGYVGNLPLVIMNTTASDAEIRQVIQPCISEVWWNDDIIVTLNHPVINPGKYDEKKDDSIIYYHLIYPRENVVLRFENLKGLEEALSLLNVDAEEVKFMELFSAQRLSEMQSASRLGHLQWWLAQVEKNKTASEQEESDKVTFTPDIEVVWIPPGTLKRSDPLGKSMKNYPDHTSQMSLGSIEIQDGFSIGKYEITQVQYAAVMGQNPAFGHGVGDNYPVYNVSWHDAMEFCNKLTSIAQSGGKISTNQFYTLPTEQQWEYACRSGIREDFYAGNISSPANIYESESMDQAGWYWYNQGCKNYGTHEVGAKAPNPYGLYDMHGNVAEWCSGTIRASEACEKSAVSAKNSEFGDYAEAGNIHAVRGGSWHQSAYQCRSIARYFRDNNDFSPTIGFRVVLIEH